MPRHPSTPATEGLFSDTHGKLPNLIIAPDDARLSEARVKLAQAWEGVEAARTALAEALRAEADYPAISARSPKARIPAKDRRRFRGPDPSPQPAAERRAARRELITALLDMHYPKPPAGDGVPTATEALLEPRVTPGLIGASAQTLDLAVALNEAKKRFRATYTKPGKLQRQYFVKLPKARTNHQGEPTDLLRAGRYLLDAIGQGSLDLLKVYHQIPIARRPVKDADGKQIYRDFAPVADAHVFWNREARSSLISVERLLYQLRTELEKDDALRWPRADIEADIAKLDTLRHAETLSLILPEEWSVRAALVLDEPRLALSRTYVAITPLLYLGEAGGPLPCISNPGPLASAKQARAQREIKRRKVEEKPYLICLPAHRRRPDTSEQDRADG